jgi:DUF4097 and DUF4098 domain-containing protein YvlB
MIIRALLTAALVASTLAASAAPVKKTWRSKQKAAIQPGGTFVLDNPVGNVQITGTDGGQVEATITRTITGADEAATEEGRKNTTYSLGGDDKTRVARTTITGRTKEWSPNVTWQVSVPRNVNVRIFSGFSQTIHVKDVFGDIFVKNVNGTIVLENVNAAAVVESANGAIIYSASRPRGNASLTTINGNITATLAPGADFRWIAETLKGDIRTTFPARGRFNGPTFIGLVNAPGGPTLRTVTLMGSVQLLAAGTATQQAQSIRRPPSSSLIPPNMTSGTTREVAEVVGEVRNGVYKYATNLGHVRVPEIRANAEILTGAGEVQIGMVTGSARVTSHGGPIQLGEIFGPITASTRAGDILVDSARAGGVLSTKGGTIRLLYTSGPTRLESGGGDIIVRQTVAPIQAETRSGDISITLDASVRTEKITATTIRGNIVLNVPARFAADIDATIETLDADADTIVCDIPGLSISRQQLSGGRTRIRATGKINGGGERVTLQAVGGDIRISTAPATPSIVAPR